MIFIGADPVNHAVWGGDVMDVVTAEGLTSSAVFSPDRRYRYALGRSWSSSGMIAFIGLNPSTADAMQDDPTIRRCLRFARDWGFGALAMLNLFAFRATDPRDLKREPRPIGDHNDASIVQICRDADAVVLAWGVHGTYLARDEEVLKLLPRSDVWTLGVTKGGSPKHPLYLRADTKAEIWNWQDVR